MVMSIGFLKALRQVYPDAGIDVIVKKGIHELSPFMPVNNRQFVFSKEAYPGIAGAWRFGRMIRKTNRYDLFFSLPDSFSSALIGYASGAAKRIGYTKELRSVLLTHGFRRKQGLHRVEEYVDLISQFAKAKIVAEPVMLTHPPGLKKDIVIININSEASSRRLPVQKAISITTAVMQSCASGIVLIGGKADISYTAAVVNQLPHADRITNLSGQTSLPELVKQMSEARLVLTTDSGPAHLANALQIPTVVLTGAGNEKNTSPYNKEDLSVIRYGKLPCEPCLKNTCVLYGSPKCLEMLDEDLIIRSIIKYVK